MEDLNREGDKNGWQRGPLKFTTKAINVLDVVSMTETIYNSVGFEAIYTHGKVQVYQLRCFFLLHQTCFVAATMCNWAEEVPEQQALT